ncbi:MAG: SH3 domain-containing protein [Thermoflexales bacterium]
MKTRQHMAGSLIAASLILGGCAVGAEKPAEIKIVSPTNNASVRVGQGINIQWTAKGDNISMIEVVITNQPYAQVATQDPKKGVPEFNAQVPWTPLQPGTHSIQVKAYNPDNKVIGQSDLVVLTAQGALPAATAAVPPTAVPVATAAGSSQPAPTATPEAPSLVVTNDFANIREGPNTAYRALGQLSKGDKAPVRGRSDDGKWYQITFKTGVGWIFGELAQANDAANKTAVAAAPPLPTAPPPPPPTATSPPPPPTAVPVAGRTAGNLTVDRVTVGNNGSVVASWNVQNISAAQFDKGDGQGFKAAAGTMAVVVDCITTSRTIRLKITNNAGATQEDAIGINVDGGLPAGTCGSSGGGGGGGSTDVCNASSPFWKAVISGNSGYTFCAKQDLEFVAGLPSVVRFSKGANMDLALKWNIYGIGGIRLKIEPNTQQCSPAGSQGQRDVAVNGSNGPDNTIYPLNANEFGFGGFKIELYVINQQGVQVGYNEKFLCVT